MNHFNTKLGYEGNNKLKSTGPILLPDDSLKNLPEDYYIYGWNS